MVQFQRYSDTQSGRYLPKVKIHRFNLLPGEVNKLDIQLASYILIVHLKIIPTGKFFTKDSYFIPISDDANFGHYDILVERPTNNYASGLDYLYWENQSSFNNPDLKPSRISIMKSDSNRS